MCMATGDHSFDGVLSDFINFEPFVKKGGLIVLDDYSFKHWPKICLMVAMVIRSQPQRFECLGVL